MSWWRASVSYLQYNSQEPGENNFGNISSPNQWLLYRVVNATQVNSTMTAVFNLGHRDALWLQSVPEYRSAEIAELRRCQPRALIRRS